MPFGLQPLHLLVILVVALLIFGPSRLPEIGRAVGKTIKEFQSATREATQSMATELQKPAEPSVQTPVPAPEPKVACKSCGKPLAAGSKFCNECGAAQ